jgi:hypothetical protein
MRAYIFPYLHDTGRSCVCVTAIIFIYGKYLCGHAMILGLAAQASCGEGLGGRPPV